jgi:hypothetical protein
MNDGVKKLIADQIQALKTLQEQDLNAVDENSSSEEDHAHTVDEFPQSQKVHESPQADPYAFFVDEDNNFHINSENSTDLRLILDTGALKSTVSDSRLLSDLKPIDKKMRTYSGSIDITHIGSMKFGKNYKIFPVYLAPAGKCNLISASQLEDHGFRMFHKNKLITVCMGSTIVEKFPRSGDLYVSSSSNYFNINTLFSVAEKQPLKDWHIILGHPADVYLKKFFELMKISNNSKSGSSSNCEVCRMAKLTRSAHSNPLPSASSPFKMIHMDVLQITPVSCGSFCQTLRH